MNTKEFEKKVAILMATNQLHANAEAVVDADSDRRNVVNGVCRIQIPTQYIQKINELVSLLEEEGGSSYRGFIEELEDISETIKATTEMFSQKQCTPKGTFGEELHNYLCATKYFSAKSNGYDVMTRLYNITSRISDTVILTNQKDSWCLSDLIDKAPGNEEDENPFI